MIFHYLHPAAVDPLPRVETPLPIARLLLAAWPRSGCVLPVVVVMVFSGWAYLPWALVLRVGGVEWELPALESERHQPRYQVHHVHHAYHRAHVPDVHEGVPVFVVEF